jgi:hypothetical protein
LVNVTFTSDRKVGWGSESELLRADVLGPPADSVPDVIPVDSQLLPICDSPQHDVGVRVLRVVVVDRRPLELSAEVGFHSAHQFPDQLLKVDPVAELR